MMIGRIKPIYTHIYVGIKQTKLKDSRKSVIQNSIEWTEIIGDEKNAFIIYYINEAHYLCP